MPETRIYRVELNDERHREFKKFCIDQEVTMGEALKALIISVLRDGKLPVS